MVGSNTELIVSEISKLTFQADENAFGDGNAAFLYEVHDGTTYSLEQYTLTIDVTPVNDVPESEDVSITVLEDVPYAFQIADFPIIDIDTDPLAAVRLQAATDGLFWVDLNENGSIDGSEAAIENGNIVIDTQIPFLRFLTMPHANGDDYATILFEVFDGTDFTVNRYTMTVNATAVNDPPTAISRSVRQDEDTVYTFSESDFSFSDPDAGDVLVSLEMEAATAGQLWVDTNEDNKLNGTELEVETGNVVLAENVSKLKYLPVEHAYGEDIASFRFEVSDGVLSSTNLYTITFNVNPINDAPTSANVAVDATEDTVYAFAEADFPYADQEDHEHDHLRLHPVESGFFWLDEDENNTLDGDELPVAANDIVQWVNIFKLRYLAPADANGAPYTTFNYQVHDGLQYSTEVYTMSINVAPVNDAPFAENIVLDVQEDEPYVLLADVFQYEDPADSDPFHKVRLQPVSRGTLWVDLDENGILNGQEVNLGIDAEVLAENFSKLKYANVAHEYGNDYATFTFEVHDGEAYSASSYTATIHVESVNDAPISSDSAVTADEDVVFTFGESMFPYSDVEGESLTMIRLRPVTNGTFWLDVDGDGTLGVDEAQVAVDDEVLVEEISSLKYLAPLHQSGDNFTNFIYQLSDGIDYSITYTMTIHVTPVNDAPISEDTEVLAIEDTPFGFTVSDFSYSDVESDPLSFFRLHSPTSGVLWIDTDSNGLLGGSEVTVSDNQVVTLAEIEMMKYLPPENAYGDAVAEFLYEAHDGQIYAETPARMVINVSPVNDLPESEDTTFTVNEDIATSFSVEDFPNLDVDGDDITQVRLQPVTVGDFWIDLNDDGVLNGVESPVSINTMVDVGNLPSLKYLAPHNENGDNFTTFLFEIRDGEGYSLRTYTMTINVVPVNDLPIHELPDDPTLEEDSALIFSTLSNNAIVISDPEEPNSTGKLSVTIETTSGTLQLSEINGLSFSEGGSDPAAVHTFGGSPLNINNALNGLEFVPTANSNGLVTITISTTDRGDDNLGTNALTTVSNLVINIQAVNDMPVLTMPVNLTGYEDEELVFGGDNQITVWDDAVESGAPIQFELRATQGELYLNAPETLNFTKGSNGENWVIFTGDLDTITNALDGFYYRPLAGFSGNVRIMANVNDFGQNGGGTAKTASSLTNIVINALNDAPVIHLPDEVPTFEENTTLSFEQTLGTLVYFSDDEERNLSGKLTVDISVSNGTLSLSAMNGLTFINGDGVDDVRLVFSGTPANVNSALSGMTYQPLPDFVGVEQLVISVSDNGDPKSQTPGDIQTTTATLDIQVQDGPVVLSIGGTEENLQLTDNSTILPFENLAIGAKNASAIPLTITLTPSDVEVGGFTADSMDESGVTFADGVYQYIGTAAEASANLKKLVFQPVENRTPAGKTESVGIALKVSGAEMEVEDRMTTLHIFSVNDSFTIEGVQTTLEISDNVPTKLFAGISVEDLDTQSKITLRINLNNADELGVWAWAGAFVEQNNGELLLSGTAEHLHEQLQELTFRPFSGADLNQQAGSVGVTRIQMSLVDEFDPQRSFTTELRIRVSNNAPTDITLDTEATPPDATHDFHPVGKLNSADIDFNDIHNFHLVRASNNSFLIINGFLYSKTELDTANLAQYSLTIQVTDLGGLTFEKTISLDLQDTDGDGFLDTDEVQHGTDPADPFSTPIGTFANATELVGGWKELDWFGVFYGNNYPWIYHGTLGWVLPVEDSANSMWLYLEDLGWVWASSATFPRMYHVNTQSWIHVSDSGLIQRWNATSQQWITF